MRLKSLALTAWCACSLRWNVRHRQAKAQTARMVAGLRKLHIQRQSALILTAWRLAQQVSQNPVCQMVTTIHTELCICACMTWASLSRISAVSACHTGLPSGVQST